MSLAAYRAAQFARRNSVRGSSNFSCSRMNLRGLRRFSAGSSKIEEEVAKFEKIGSDWWDPLSINGTGPLHSMNPCRVGFIVEQVQSNHYLQNLRSGCSRSSHKSLVGLDVLDVGCGGGLLTESLARLGAKHVTGVDASISNIQIARAHASLDVRTENINYLDCLVGMLTLNHLNNLVSNRSHSFLIMSLRFLSTRTDGGGTARVRCSLFARSESVRRVCNVLSIVLTTYDGMYVIGR